MHSWIFRHRRRLEELYGLAPGRREDPRAAPAGPRALGPRRPAVAQAEDLRARVLVPLPRRAAS